ncbi:homoserine O-acetyltransferase [Oceaniserpentilla sp. 4NH20-0058]|uniref:homoserine O-succinyltransferase MetX n=1 Tax=Oceaniserpentilla sp. 4NH20-0058 TaxID=3127660 RepID=UPI0031035153
MPQAIPANSVGVVTPQIASFNEPLELRSGKVLERYELVYETYGQLNAEKSNAILICHALSGHHHAAGYHSMEDKKPGWWDSCIGPGKAIDTNKFFVICLNNLGGCHGSTGPTSINPETNEPYGSDFPMVRVRDWVESQARLADYLGIEKFAAVVGGSLGGMQAMRWAIQYPERLHYSVVIASAPKLSAQNIAFNEVARNVIMKDPEFHNGHYLKHSTLPKTGLMQARMLAHLTYLSDDAMGEKFGRHMTSENVNYDYTPEFEVESYLHYQGNKFSTTFDANTYLLMTKALDYFDPAQYYEDDLAKCLGHAQCKFLVVSFTTDWRFPPERSEEIVDALIEADKNVVYAKVESEKGHDAFLIPIPRYVKLFSAYMNRVAEELSL